MPDTPPPLLQSLTLQGFKSFAGKVRLEFDGGVCAIIGPNGSGKSNVVEALRWVTHQARARELRTHKATELIFHGSGTQGQGGKAALGLAEVELELRPPTGTLSLSRRIYRDGTSEQDLQGRPARVRDIHAALRGTGLGPGGLAVIGQGEVSTVVQASGASLLGYLQEAAGLSRAVAARQETEQRLEQAAASLAELSFLVTQARERASLLTLQAQNARHERALQLELLSMQAAQSRARALELEEEIDRLRQTAAELERQSGGLSEQIIDAQAQLSAAREAAVLAQAQQAAQQQAYKQQQQLAKAAQEQQEQQRRYLHTLLSQRQQLEEDLARLPSTPPAEISPETSPADPAPHQANLQRTRQHLTELEAAAQQLQKQLFAAQETHQQRREAQARYSAQQETWQASIRELEQQLEQRRAALEEAQQAEQLRRAELIQAQDVLSAWNLEQQQRAQERVQVQQAQAGAQQSLAHVQREVARLGASLDSYERYGEGPRRALSSDHPGIVGSVADVLEVPAQYEVALQAALGRRLEQVVVERAQDAQSIIEMLRVRGGRATFLPLDLLRPPARRGGALLQAAGVIGNLADLCPSDPPQVSESLLGTTLLMQNLERATMLARQYTSRPRLVTLEGDLLESGGAITGGQRQGGGFSVLADQRRYHELQAEAQRLQGQLAALEGQLSALAPEPAPDLQAQVNELSALQRRLEQQLAQAQAAHDSTGQELQRTLQQLGALRPPTQDKDTDPAPLQAELDSLQRQISAARAAERQHTELFQQAQEQQRIWQQWTQSQEQRHALQQRLQTTEQAIRAQQEVAQQADSAAQQRQAELGALQHLQPEAAQLIASSDALSRRYSTLLAQQNTLRARLEDAQLQLARREGARQPIADGCLPAGTARQWQATAQQLRRELEQLGMVNALAEDELVQASEHLRSLTEQQQDVQAAADELSSHLSNMAAQENQATQQAFERTRQAFAEYTGELLGGSGELEAEYTERQLRGLSLTVQPRGKRTRNLNLLSAGERTMAGLAFLFALGHAASQAHTSLPLAVLDEVDAPLDEANIRRFTHFLQAFAAKGTQFIVITHQKATMEVARSIWGVTTDQSGASRLLSIKQE